jgi:hypothetical protein
MEKKPIIKLRTYRGRDINYDANGNIKNENNLVSLDYNTKIWVLFMKNLPLNGYCKVVVEKAFKVTSTGYEAIEDLTPYQKEVDDAFNLKKEVALTTDQKRIAELEAKIEMLMNNGNNVKQNDVKPEEKKDDGLDGLRAEYERVVGKKAHHMAKAETLQESIDNAKNN